MSTHNEGSGDLPGDHDDPRPGSTLYWLVLMFLWVLVSAWGLHGLANWVRIGWEQEGVKAPAGGGELGRVRAEQAADLELAQSGDVLTLKSGMVIDAGLVYELKDPEDATVKFFVKDVPFIKIYAIGRESDYGKFTVVQGGKALKFLPSEVKGVEKGHGKKLAVPLSQARRAFLAKYGRG